MINNDIEKNEIDINFLARFACLVNGVNVVADAAERLGIDTERSNDWIKPVFLQKYVDERYEDMKYNMQKGINGDDDEIYSW